MRVKVRETIDYSKVVNENQLNSFELLYVGIMRAISQIPFVSERKDRQLAEEYRQKVEAEENLKEWLLSTIYRAYSKGIKHKDEDIKIRELTIAIPRSSEHILREIKDHKEFSSYNLKILECDKDLLRSFPDIKIRVQITGRSLGNES